jgi:hypothetical protein
MKSFYTVPIGCFHYTGGDQNCRPYPTLWAPFGLYIAAGNIIKCKNYQQCIFLLTDRPTPKVLLGITTAIKYFYERFRKHNKGEFLISRVTVSHRFYSRSAPQLALPHRPPGEPSVVPSWSALGGRRVAATDQERTPKNASFFGSDSINLFDFNQS